MSGCAICVYDLYEESLEAYENSLNTLISNLDALGIPEHEWPESIRPSNVTNNAETSGESGSGAGERKAQVLSAFEELERSLQAKREAGSQS